MRWQAEFLADKYAVRRLLEFLKDMEVGSREDAVEKEKE